MPLQPTLAPGLALLPQPCKYTVQLLPTLGSPPALSTVQQDVQQHAQVNRNPARSTAQQNGQQHAHVSAQSTAQLGGLTQAGIQGCDTLQWQEAVTAGAHFRAIAAAAAGMPTQAPASTDPIQPNAASATAGYGPHRPFFAHVLANRRLTAVDHFQDTRHIELDLQGSGMHHQPGQWGLGAGSWQPMSLEDWASGGQ